VANPTVEDPLRINLAARARLADRENKGRTLCSAPASWKIEGDYRPLDSGSAMLSSERISASMPNLAGWIGKKVSYEFVTSNRR
jgi:hypothetical protein